MKSMNNIFFDIPEYIGKNKTMLGWVLIIIGLMIIVATVPVLVMSYTGHLSVNVSKAYPGATTIADGWLSPLASEGNSTGWVAGIAIPAALIGVFFIVGGIVLGGTSKMDDLKERRLAKRQSRELPSSGLRGSDFFTEEASTNYGSVSDPVYSSTDLLLRQSEYETGDIPGSGSSPGSVYSSDDVPFKSQGPGSPGGPYGFIPE